MSTPEFNELLYLVYRYYPKRCSYVNDNYKTSTEYLRYMNIVGDLAMRRRKSEYILLNITKCIDGYCVLQREHSDNSNYPSIHYTILLHKNHPLLDDDVALIHSLNGRRIDLELYFSLLGNYCYYYIIETVGGVDTFTWKFSILKDEQLPLQERKLIALLCSKMVSLGYKLINDELAHKLVPEVETELTNSGDATLFNCLFTDMETRYY